MIQIKRSNGEIYSQCTVAIPSIVKELAKRQGINISRTLTEALLVKIEGIDSSEEK